MHNAAPYIPIFSHAYNAELEKNTMLIDNPKVFTVTENSIKINLIISYESSKGLN